MPLRLSCPLSKIPATRARPLLPPNPKMKIHRLLVWSLLPLALRADAPQDTDARVTAFAEMLITLTDEEWTELYAEATALTADANENPILHPTDPTTYSVTDGSTTVQVPYNMVYVPAGSFTVGTGTNATTATADAYCIGRYEVTNAEWKAYLTAIGSTSYPAHWSAGTYPSGKANHPVLYVSLNSALAYCAWISAQTGWSVSVPTSAQWEKAARGPNATLYPWGASLGAAYNSSTGILTTNCNYNAVTAAYYLYHFPNLAATYTNAKSSYYGGSTTVGKIAAYDTSGGATLFSLSASGGVNGWVNHDTYTGFIYTSVYDALMDTGGNTTPVGAYPAGQSGYGCHDMAGNVFEWTTSLITATNGAESGLSVNEVRGGSWYATGNSARSISIGEGRAASGAFNTVGFRIVRNLTATSVSTGGTTTTSTSPTTTGTVSTGTTTTGTTTATGTNASSASGGGGAPSHWFLLALSALGLSRLRRLKTKFQIN